MSAPTMSASGHGSSATTPSSLPTPVSQAQQGGIRLEGGSGARRAMKESGLYDLFRSQTLPTPRKSDADRGGRGDVLSQLQGHASRHAGMMGTPTANAAPRGSVLRKLKGRMTSDQDGFDRAPTMSEVLHFDRPDMPHGMMPTPVKPNGGRRLSAQEIETGRRANGAKAQIDTPNLLRHAAEILPTPTKRDSRMDSWSPAYDRRKSPTMDAVMDGAMTDRAPDKWAGARAGGDVAEPWADWNGGLARHLRLDDGLSAWVVGTRIALGSRKGTAAASLIVEAFGDAVLPQIPEAIGRAILRTEAALDAVLARDPHLIPGDEP